jgi:hypothetical protein
MNHISFKENIMPLGLLYVLTNVILQLKKTLASGRKLPCERQHTHSPQLADQLVVRLVFGIKLSMVLHSQEQRIARYCLEEPGCLSYKHDQPLRANIRFQFYGRLQSTTAANFWKNCD